MTPYFSNPLHLYRSLLRETTYLFDENVRKHFHKYITSSFRAKSPGIKFKHGQKTSDKIVHNLPSLDERHQLKRGRKLLYTLERANQGYLRSLSNVLKLAYGCKGQRRRNLMTEIMLDDSFQHANSSIEPSTSSPQEQVKKFGKGWKPPMKFERLLRSQLPLQGWLEIGGRITLKPKIQATTRAGRPMPNCRIVNTTRKWYAKNAALLMPYLHEKEWEYIKAKAEAKEFEIPKRRPPASVSILTKGDAIEEELKGFDTNLLIGPPKTMIKKQQMEIGRPHNLKPRFLRRMYARSVLKHTPLAVSVDEGKDYILKWDDGQRNLTKVVQPVDDAHTEALFGR